MNNKQPQRQQPKKQVIQGGSAFLEQYVPYSQEAEEAVIGAIIINPAGYHQVATFLKAEDFFILRHQHVWTALVRLIERGDAVDYVTLLQELKNMDKLDEIGGPPYITQLINNTPTSMHAEVYGRLVERAAIRRRLLSYADRVKENALNEELTAEKVMDDVHADLILTTGRTVLQSMVSLGEALTEYDAMQKGEVGLPTGLSDLDKTIGGLVRGKVTLVGGVTGMGKTAFCMTTILTAARAGARIALFPLEQNRARMITRLLALETGIPRSRIELSQVKEGQEAERLEQAKARLYGLPLFIFDRPLDPDFALTPRHLLTICNSLAYEHGLDLVVVDHMGLMTSGKYDPSDYNDKAFVSRSMPILADKLNVAFLVAAQVNEHKVLKQSDKRPQLGDLMYVGEKDADVMLFLYRDSEYDSETAVPNEAEIIVAKNRDFGVTGTIYSYFNGEGFINPTNRTLQMW